MSRKSLPKKDTIVWCLCPKCDSHLLAKDRDVHSANNCTEAEPIESATIPLIRNKQFATSSLAVKPVTDDLRSVKQKHLDNFVFLNETVFPLCELVLGDYVLVSSPALPGAAPIVRCVWPVAGTHSPAAAAVSEDGKVELIWPTLSISELRLAIIACRIQKYLAIIQRSNYRN